MRGGGVGFYIRENLSAKIIEELSPFQNKIFESITIQLSYPTSSKSVLLTSAYRSNGTILDVTPVNGRTYFVMNMFAYSRKVSTVERLKGQVPEIHKNERDENTRSDPHGK